MYQYKEARNPIIDINPTNLLDNNLEDLGEVTIMYIGIQVSVGIC